MKCFAILFLVFLNLTSFANSEEFNRHLVAAKAEVSSLFSNAELIEKSGPDSVTKDTLSNSTNEVAASR